MVRIAGTALIQVTSRSASISQNPWRRNRRSTSSAAPACRLASRATTWALMWKSGSGLKPRSAGVSRLCRATARATCSSRSSVSSTALGAPVEPDVSSSTEPGCGRGIPRPGGCGPATRPKVPQRGHTGAGDTIGAVTDHHLRPDHADRPGQLGHRGVRVHRDRAPARGQHAQVGGAEVNGILDVDQDPRSGRDRGRVQRCGALAGPAPPAGRRTASGPPARPRERSAARTPVPARPPAARDRPPAAPCLGSCGPVWRRRLERPGRCA